MVITIGMVVQVIIILTALYGFSHTHLSGTGVADYCDILLMPTAGNVIATNIVNNDPKQGLCFSIFT